MKKRQVKTCLFYENDNEASLGAPTGQTFAQEPHSMHSASFTLKTPPSSAIQDVGHSEAQAPHPIHDESIWYAIGIHLPIFNYKFIVYQNIIISKLNHKKIMWCRHNK